MIKPKELIKRADQIKYPNSELSYCFLEICLIKLRLIRTHTNMNNHTHMYKCVLTCIYTDVNTLIQMSMPMHIYMWKHADESTIIRMLIHIFMHAHDNTLIYIWVRLYESEICISKKYAHMLICIYLYMYEYASLYMCICTVLHTFTFFLSS